jgi:hypothetical protein
MKTTSSKLLIAAVVFGAASLAAASVTFGNTSFGDGHASARYGANVVNDDASVTHALKFLKLAQTHADICLQNEQQCLAGCDGAQSCSNQCEVNYQGCMDQGG